MKAIVRNEYGSPDVLELEAVPPLLHERLTIDDDERRHGPSRDHSAGEVS